MEGPYYYDSDGEEQSFNFNYYASGEHSDPENIEAWSDSGYDEGSTGSPPQQLAWGCCVSQSSSEEEQSQPDCSCQCSSSGSDDASSRSESDDSRAESEWETDSGTGTVDGKRKGKSCTGSTCSCDSCRNLRDEEASSSSWETASTESSSSWETATTCSCEAAEAACQSCASAELPRWDDEAPPEYPTSSPADKWMSHPFSEGGGESGGLAPLPPSELHLLAPRQRRPNPYIRRPRKMNSSGEGRRQEQKTQVSEQKRAHRPCTVRQAVPAPANPVTMARRPRRRRFRWKPLQKRRINGRRRQQTP